MASFLHLGFLLLLKVALGFVAGDSGGVVVSLTGSSSIFWRLLRASVAESSAAPFCCFRFVRA